MTHKEGSGFAALRGALLDEKSWSKQRLSAAVQRVLEQLPMPTRVAQAVVAHRSGLRIGRYLSGQDMADVQSAITRLGSMGVAAADPAPVGRPRASARPASDRDVSLPKEFRLSDPILTRGKLQEAKEMAAIYPLLYVIENSLREIIQRVMRKSFGTNWWDTALTSAAARNIKNRVDVRLQKEKYERWHQRRGAHPLDYTDLDDLKTIVVSKPGLFFPLLGQQAWFEQFMRELYPSRCVLCHMNPLSRQTIRHVRVKADQWQTLAAAAELPAA